MAKGKYQEWLEPDSLIKLQSWARDGLIDEQIAKNMGITTTTLYEWKRTFSSISESLKKGKEVVDIEVENALLRRALGYEYEEDCSTKEGVVRLRKYSHPDTTAQIFWLKNRKPKNWRDKPVSEEEGNEALKDLAKAIAELRQ